MQIDILYIIDRRVHRKIDRQIQRVRDREWYKVKYHEMITSESWIISSHIFQIPVIAGDLSIISSAFVGPVASHHQTMHLVKINTGVTWTMRLLISPAFPLFVAVKRTRRRGCPSLPAAECIGHRKNTLSLLSCNPRWHVKYIKHKQTKMHPYLYQRTINVICIHEGTTLPSLVKSASAVCSAQPSLPIIWTSSTECPALPVALSAAKAVWSEEFNGNLKASTCGIFAETPGWQVETNRYIIYV